MITVGIIANPAAGKDIRRLVAHASVFNNHEKVNIVRRVLLGLDAVGVEHALVMPDYFGIGQHAQHGLRLDTRVERLEMPLDNTLDDSANAARLLREQGARVIVTLGGDGTNRAVAKECADVPLVPISTGTNNVFPQMIEGTLAGLAAGMIARGVVDAADTIHRNPRLEIVRDAAPIDLALIDAAVYDKSFVGTRAIWETGGLRQIILTRAEPNAIGFSAIGGYLDDARLAEDEGLVIELGAGGRHVLAPIAPGLVKRVDIRSYRKIKIGERVALEYAPAVLALDGERTLVLHKRDPLHVRLSADGPRVVDVRATLSHAVAQGFFVRAEGTAGAR